MDSNKTIWWVLGLIALAAVGFIVIPPLMKKYSNKLYKKSLKEDEIDFDNLGPEIVKKEDAQKED